MGSRRTSVRARHRAKASSRPSVRCRLSSGGVFASATILVLGLVVAPSHVDPARTEVRTVQVATMAFSSTAPSGAVLEKLRIGTQTQTGVPVIAVVGGGNADIKSAAVAVPLSIDATKDPTTNGLQLNNAALAATTSDLSIPDAILSVIGPIILFAPVILLVVLACPPCALINVVTSLINSILIELTTPRAVAGTSIASLEANVTAAPASLTSAEAPRDPIAFLVENAELLGAGLGKSVNVAVGALPSLAVAPFSVAFFSLLSPPHIPTILSAGAEGLDSFWNGVRLPSDVGYDEIVPGFYIPTDITPGNDAYQDVVENSVLPATVLAFNKVIGNLTAAGVPKVVEQTLLSSEKVAIAVQQARVLVRTTTVSAIQDTILAATSSGDVGGAVENGVARVQKAIFGDPDKPDAHRDPFDTSSPRAPSIAQLGAIGSVTTSVKQAVNDVGESLNTSGSSRRRAPVLESQQLVGARDLANANVVAVKSELRNGHAIVGSAGGDNGSPGGIASSTRNRPVRDAVANEIKRVVTKVSDLKNALKSGRDDDNHNTDGNGGQTP